MSLEYYLMLAARSTIIVFGVTLGVVSGFMVIIFGFIFWKQMVNNRED